MSKFATATPAPPKGVVQTIGSIEQHDTTTHEGGAGWARDAKSELYLLAVTNMVSEGTFYESGKERDARFEQLIAQVAAEDPDWVARMIPWLRTEANMRSASIVMAAELVHAKLTAKAKAGAISNRSIIDSAIQRADEPAEMLGYWRSKFGRNLPMPVKRGVADAAVRLFTERAFLKYGSGDGYRMADVIDITHPDPKAPWQSALFKHMLDARHGHGVETDALLPMILANQGAMALDSDAFRAAFTTELVKAAGLTWEVATSRYGKLDAKFLDSMIPDMGIFALVRNLRNFDEAAISAASAAHVNALLTDPEVIAKSRMFPLRFYSAWANTGTLTWGSALEKALEHSLANVPSLPGRTLVLVDTSGSMGGTISDKSKAMRWQVAGLFGAALALRAEKATLVAFQSYSAEMPTHKVGSVLRTMEGFKDHVGGGTSTWEAVRKHYDAHDRVIIVTDEQAHDSPRGIPTEIGTAKPLYVFNVAGYKNGSIASGGRRYTFGGLSDAAFLALPLLERNEDEAWPF
jgi:hypothetical protein